MYLGEVGVVESLVKERLCFDRLQKKGILTQFFFFLKPAFQPKLLARFSGDF